MLTHMNQFPSLLIGLVMSILLTACGTMRSSVVVEPAPGHADNPAPIAATTPPRTLVPGGSYQVVRGDTLYSIAFRKAVDVRDLAQWNGIAAPYTIWPGQKLTLSPNGPRPEPHVSPATVASASAPQSAATTSPTPATAGAPVFEKVPEATASSASVASVPASVSPNPVSPPVPAAAASTNIPVAGVPATPQAALPPPVAAPVSGASRNMAGVSWRWPADGGVFGHFNSNDAIPGIEIAGKPGDPVRAAADGVVVYSGNGLVGYGELVIIKHNDSFLSAYGHNRKRLVKEGQRVTGGQAIAEMGSTGASRTELEFQIRKDGNPVNPLDYLPKR